MNCTKGELSQMLHVISLIFFVNPASIPQIKWQVCSIQNCQILDKQNFPRISDLEMVECFRLNYIQSVRLEVQ